MEELANSISSAVISLTPHDALLSFNNHPLVYFFENQNSDIDFMPPDKLKASLFKALRNFPLLLGHIKETSNGTVNVLIDKSNLNMPEFLESTSTVNYKDVKNSGFSWNSWPSGVATAGPAVIPDKDGIIKLLSIHVIRLANNSGVILFCNIPHYIIDGVGYYKFLRHWAMQCRRLRYTGASEEHVPSCYTFDRNALRVSMQGRRSPLDIETYDALTSAGVLSSFLAFLPLSFRTRLIAIGARFVYGQGYFFHISDTALKDLHILIKEYSDDIPLTSYSLLAALFRVAVSRAILNESEELGIVAKATNMIVPEFLRRTLWKTAPHVLLNVVHTYDFLPSDIRSYIGNSIYMRVVQTPAEYLQDNTDTEVHGHLAAQITHAMSKVNNALLGEFYDTVATHPKAYSNLTTYMGMRPTALSVIDERHYKTDSVDFGDGSPAWISGLPRHIPNFIALLSAPEHVGGGSYVYASLKPTNAEAMLCDKFFTTYAKLLF
ncbi:hypothetical protein H4S08_003028 [Coemansia sp. RSA 1365]|nr:hypothetical protein H4S08_003028 [Coemansia sp. RSA 1365]